MMNKKECLAYFGHHKAATTWILKIINQVSKEIAIKHVHFHSPKMFDFDLGKKIVEIALDFFSFTNADINYVTPVIDSIKGFHVVRDPRDIVVSAYFSYLNSHPSTHWPELVAHREKLKGLNKDDGLMFLMENINSIEVDGVPLSLFDSMMAWDYQLPNVMELRFEELIANPYKLFLKIFKFLDILDDSEKALSSSKAKIRGEKKINILKAMAIIYRNDFEFIAKGRKPGEENVNHHFRKGLPGDWVNHFNDEHKRYFKEHYNKLLVKLGYTEDENW